ncbi:cadherin-related tumor suppressor-like isoform X12 [Penaeus chinensis]|uniref:cadherin-related tumor suppressor-like isoform X12 n=1 Tax=Penaeus chinensis TaxID=139456 RepID=UPI001FB5A48C|nr:cadherin-related tumor suppressor-like isoform X12 [Penaeus chinensis]
MMSTKERSVFGLFKWRISAILVIYVSLPFAASQASSACYEHFQVDGQVSEGYGENVYVTKSDIPETLGVGELLYTLTWESGGSPNTSDSTTFMEYFEFDESETNTWKVKVKKSLEGLPDYPVSTVLMITNIEFSGYSQTCNVQLKHNLKDENTAPPQFDSPSYVVSIREDYPVELDIADLQIKVNDFDKDSPNNQFAVEVEGSQCPLKASQEKYTSVEGAQTLVLLWLTSELDYEEQKQLTCTLRAQDLGTPSLTTTADLTVNVENRQDEPPVFGYKFYYSTLESSLAGEVLDVKPEAILAENVEGTGVTYSMENARSDVNGLEYFAIDISTGAVSVTKDIEDSFLELERVSFILKATGEDASYDVSVLDVQMPLLPYVGLHFEKFMYATEVLRPGQGDVVLRVHAVATDGGQGEISYAFEGGEDENFAIDAKTGEISSKKPELEIKEYGLTAVATAGELSDMAQVIIRVVEPLDAEVMIKNNLIRVEAEEGVEEQELAEIEAVGDVAEICVTDVTAPAAEGFFSVELVDGAWKLKAKSSLDYEETKQISFKLKARKEGDGDCSSSGFSDQLLRDEALVVVTVTDVNDAEPKFVVPATPQTVIAYPTDPALQKVVGPVITLQAEDEDSLPTYSLESAVDGLWVDEDTGAVYLQEENACGQECDVTARASDGEHSATAEIKVLSLDMDHIYSLTLDNVNVPDVDSELDSISAKAGVKISKVYVTPKIAETRTPSRAQRTPPAARRLGSSRWSGWESRVESWQLAVHVYAVEGEQLMALDQLNQKLTEGNTNHEASSFEERDAFDPPQPEGPSTVGYQVAVGILGALLGLLLIAAGFLAYRWQRGRSDRRRQEPKGISTVGGAYPNLSFNDEEDRTDSASQERKNGSLGGAGGGGGYKIDERRDSPPLFISSLSASKSEPPVSKSSEQQRGLRRVDPGKPEYYGMSSPTPPPSYSSNNAASSSSSSMYPNLSSSGAGPSSSSSSSAAKPSSSSSSSMYPSLPTPSYQSQKSVRKEPPPLGSAPAKSILRGTAPDTGQEVPLTLFSSGQEPSMPEKDYDEEVKTSAFSGLKKSPPPRRASTHALAEDAAAADRKEDSDQGEDDERRKSVAFKIMVDTKEIQPENEGPAQKKAAAKSDAMDILAANAKKMAEEGADDDSDDDVDEKF